MTRPSVKLAAGTNGSVVVETCQVCGSAALRSLLFIGYLPPVNGMPAIGTRPVEQPAYPAEVLRCDRCSLVQLGLVVDPAILFPPTYPYTSGTTRILRENFAQLASEVAHLALLGPGSLVVDIGSNDGTLLANFQSRGHRVRGIEPTNAGNLANGRGIPTDISFFDRAAVERVLREDGPAQVVTAANVFAHIEDVHSVVDNIVLLMAPDGVFISESHYWLSLVETVQYDTIYHEHLRYYSLESLEALLGEHGLHAFHARRIPTHGGSIRVYAARAGLRPPTAALAPLRAEERAALDPQGLARFRQRVIRSKLDLLALLRDQKRTGARIYGVGAPSRASTLINYVGLDDGILDCVVEIAGSYKIGLYIPGTVIPVRDESCLFIDQPEYALLLSWHIADELMPKLRQNGFKGDFIIPLPEPRVVTSGGA